MADDQRAPLAVRREHSIGLTIYGCEPDEADLFERLAPRFGIAISTTAAPVSEADVASMPRNRCVSVAHTSDLSERDLRTLKAAGVEYVNTRSIGLDHIDLTAAAEFGITVENVVYAPDGVADFTLMLILMSIRNVAGSLGEVRGRDLRDLTVGVVGAGRIGQAVIRRLLGFGCRVLACDGVGATTTSADFVSLDRLLRETDVVTLHVPLTAETHHLIGREQIASMKPGAILVNTARGALVDTDALIAALERAHLGGAGLDVVDGDEGRLPNAIVTPHVAFHTLRTLSETVEATLMNCLNFERSRTNDEAQGRDLVRGMLRGA